MIFENEIANFRGMEVVLRAKGNIDDKDLQHTFEVENEDAKR